MRQLLILGFYCEVYRREPLCRIYINDILVDEFNIPHTTRKKIDVGSYRLSPKHYGNSVSDLLRIESNTPFLKYVEFDDIGSNFLDIRIEVQNDDNNYSNGFMTKQTVIMAPYMFLSSKKILDNLNEIENNWQFSRKNYNIQSKKDIDAYYCGSRNSIFINIAPYMNKDFPNTNITHNKQPTYESWIGHTGSFHVKFYKKLGFWTPRKYTQKKRWRLGECDIMKYLYDKYKQYEDTRSTNT